MSKRAPTADAGARRPGDPAVHGVEEERDDGEGGQQRHRYRAGERVGDQRRDPADERGAGRRHEVRRPERRESRASHGARQQDHGDQGVPDTGDPGGRTRVRPCRRGGRGLRGGRSARATRPSEPSARHLRVDGYTSGHGLREDPVHPGGKGGRTVGAHVRFVVPQGIDDLARPSGGNAYDRRIRDGLRARGWDVHDRSSATRPAVPAPWAVSPDGALVLVDGLVASAAGPVLLPEADRLRLVVLVHMPLGGVEVPEDDEAAVLRRAPPPSSRPAPGPGSASSTGTGSRRSASPSPGPARTSSRRPRARRTAAGSCASARSSSTRGRTCWSRHSPASRTSPGPARSSDRSTASRRSSTACAAGPPTPASPTASASPVPWPGTR